MDPIERYNAKQLQQVTNYATDLEIEVDRLRRRDVYLHEKSRAFVEQVIKNCGPAGNSEATASSLNAIGVSCREFKQLLSDTCEPAGYHPAFDQVVAIALRPLIDHVFLSQQRLHDCKQAVLHLDLKPDFVNWFPTRLRHILDNLISNALRFRDPDKGEVRVSVQSRDVTDGLELKFTDNGMGISESQLNGMLHMYYRAGPTRGSSPAVGLAVVKMLVEQCCGSIDISSGEGQGTSVTVVLPHYKIYDYVNSSVESSSVESAKTQ